MNILLTGPNGFVGARIRDAMTVIPAPSLRTLGEDDVRRLVDPGQRGPAPLAGRNRRKVRAVQYGSGVQRLRGGRSLP